jgi:hypothetical protein
MQLLQNEGAHQNQVIEEESYTNACTYPSCTRQREKYDKENWSFSQRRISLSIVDMCDGVILDTEASMCKQVNIQDAYVSIPIVSVDYEFKNVIGDEETL